MTESGSTVRGQGRRRLILAAAEEVFAQFGFEAATVRDIGQRAGVLSGSLYYYFDSKEEIAKALIGNFIDEILAGQKVLLVDEPSPGVAIRRFVEQSITLVMTRTSLVSIMYSDWPRLRTRPDFGELNEKYSLIAKAWTEQLALGAKSGVFRPELDPGLVYRTTQACLVSTARWYDSSGALGHADLVKQITILLMAGMELNATVPG
jgi:AcrR family transcriptional regulator